jgi:hypothetical protein
MATSNFEIDQAAFAIQKIRKPAHGVKVRNSLRPMLLKRQQPQMVAAVEVRARLDHLIPEPLKE